MIAPKVIYHIARADFLERARRYSFLLVMGATMYLGFALDRGDIRLELDNYRGILNSAWVGSMMSASAVLFLSLFGFYLVKDTLARDLRTGVGQIIASSPISRSAYCLGKWLSNWAVLSVLIIIVIVAAVVLQVLGGESAQIDLPALLLPFLLLALPAMAVVAALAVLFESISWLRGGGGNVLYFLLYMAGLSVPVMTGVFWIDWSGIVVIYRSMGDALREVYPAYGGTFHFTLRDLPDGGIHVFDWPGVTWSVEIVLSRILWVGGALVIVLGSTAFFHRFDTSRERVTRRQKARGTSEPPEASGEAEDSSRAGHPATGIHLPFRVSRFFPILAAELHLMVGGQPWWWYGGVVAGILGGALSPIDVARRAWLPIVWLWPLTIWSALGTREKTNQTHQIVFSSPHPLRRQLPAIWFAGVIVTAIAGSGVGINLLWHGETAPLAAWAVGALFIPTLGLALGVWSESPRLFEIVYLVLWYFGPFHPLDFPHLDFIGAADASLEAGIPPVYLLATGMLMGLSVLGRVRQLRT